MRFKPAADFRNSKAERLYVGERKFSVTEIRFPRRHSPREPSRAKPQTEPQAGSNGFAFSKQKMRKAGWPLGDPHACPCGDPSERCRAHQLMATRSPSRYLHCMTAGYIHKKC